MKIISLSAYHLILWAFLDNLIEVLEEAREVLEQVDKEAQTLSSAGSYKHPRTQNIDLPSKNWFLGEWQQRRVCSKQKYPLVMLYLK